MVRLLVTPASELKRELLASIANRDLSQARDSLAADLAREVSADEAADVLAQAVVCAAAIVGEQYDSVALAWLRDSLGVWEQWVIDRAIASSSQLPTSEIRNLHLYDEFLHHFAPTTRRRHGVFFTPQPIADFIVRQIDASLISDFDLPAGLASQSALRTPHSALVFLDPACGTGVFLLALIDHLHRHMGDDWNDFVPNLLPRLIGIELLPVPAFLAKLNIATKLASTGYDFRHSAKLSIHTGDALSPDPKSEILNPKSTLPVILGNPPFSSLSTNTNPWIAHLVRGDDDIRGYVRAGDERLGERKTWLHDDYVKFIRLAQWHVEEAGSGIVSFVTNRGYLDNATFRLMRRELMRVFSHIRIVDLHGSRKGGEVSPNGEPDENVFGLDQGVAIGIFSRPQTPTRSASEGASCVRYSELWGARDSKLAALDSHTLPTCEVTPAAPHTRFVPTTTHAHPEYTSAWSLADAMPLNTTASVTARDHFVVAFTREELEHRIAEFRDLSIPDDVIRERYFNRTRSSRYERGDTRSWKLGAARQTVANEKDWQAKIVRCLYRPFDWRWAFWHPAMIDWPRSEVTRHLMECQGARSQEPGAGREHSLALSPQPRTPLCLIARRQQLPAQPCTFFWISDGLALDGVIRSDNRGSESLFPLWQTAATPEANFSTGFIEQFASCVGSQLESENVFAYIYALFHSPAYRERYAADLRSDFPRILLPGSKSLYASLAAIGQRLIDLHLLRADARETSHIDETLLDGFRVGGYYVLRKWLRPKHRSQSDPQYTRIAAAIDETIELMAKIDVTIGQHGGFPAAFAP